MNSAIEIIRNQENALQEMIKDSGKVLIFREYGEHSQLGFISLGSSSGVYNLTFENSELNNNLISQTDLKFTEILRWIELLKGEFWGVLARNYVYPEEQPKFPAKFLRAFNKNAERDQEVESIDAQIGDWNILANMDPEAVKILDDPLLTGICTSTVEYVTCNMIDFGLAIPENLLKFVSED